MNSKTTYLYILLIVVIIGLLFAARYLSNGNNSTPQETALDSFAQCLANNGAIFYGAFWCPHCQEQKKILANSSFIPYEECSTPNGQGQLQHCADAGITSYPLWRFADGSELGGVRQLSELAEKTGCDQVTEI